MRSVLWIIALAAGAGACERATEPGGGARTGGADAAGGTNTGSGTGVGTVRAEVGAVEPLVLAQGAEAKGAVIRRCEDGTVELDVLGESAVEGVAQPGGLEAWCAKASRLGRGAMRAPWKALEAREGACKGTLSAVGVEPGKWPEGLDQVRALDAAAARCGLAADPATRSVALASPDGSFAAAGAGATARVVTSYPIMTGGTPVITGPLAVMFAGLKSGGTTGAVALGGSDGEWSLEPLGWSADSGFFVLAGTTAGGSRVRVWMVAAP